MAKKKTEEIKLITIREPDAETIDNLLAYKSRIGEKTNAKALIHAINNINDLDFKNKVLKSDLDKALNAVYRANRIIKTYLEVQDELKGFKIEEEEDNEEF